MILLSFRSTFLLAAIFLVSTPPARSDEKATKIEARAHSSALRRGALIGDSQFDCKRGPCTLDEFMDDARVCALLVIKSGTIRLERFNENINICNHDEADSTKHQHDGWAKEYGIASVTKSITSTLMGHAIATRHGARTRAEFEVFLRQPVDRFLPQLGSRVSAGGYAGVPLERVLRMRSGVRWSEYSFNGWFDRLTDLSKFNRRVKDDQRVSIVEFAKDYAAKETRPGFNYSALDASINAAVTEEILGNRKLTDFLASGLWTAIGAKAGARWKADYTGTAIGACCFYLRVGDLARFGLLVLNKGRSQDGTPVIPHAWFDLATSHGPNNADAIPSGNYSRNSGCPLDYRYQWWLFPSPRTDFTGVGINGQFLHIYPDEDALVLQISDWGSWSDDLECESFAVHDALVRAAR